jgi:hypothetical protein
VGLTISSHQGLGITWLANFLPFHHNIALWNTFSLLTHQQLSPYIRRILLISMNYLFFMSKWNLCNWSLNGKIITRKLAPQGVLIKEEDRTIVTWVLINMQKGGLSITFNQQLKLKVVEVSWTRFIYHSEMMFQEVDSGISSKKTIHKSPYIL